MPTKAVTRVQTFCLLFWSSCQGLLLLGNCSRPDVQAVPPQRSESLGSTDAHLGKHTPPFAQTQGHVVALCKTTLKTLKDSAHRVVAVAVAVAMAVTSNNIQPPSKFSFTRLGTASPPPSFLQVLSQRPLLPRVSGAQAVEAKVSVYFLVSLCVMQNTPHELTGLQGVANNHAHVRHINSLFPESSSLLSRLPCPCNFPLALVGQNCPLKINPQGHSTLFNLIHSLL